MPTPDSIVALSDPCVDGVPACLPADDPLRAVLHNEVHARPTARIHLPALIIDIAVIHDAVTREAACAHLQRLPGHADLQPAQLRDNFLRLRGERFSLRWERHTEFSRYTLVQALPEAAQLDVAEPELMSALALPAGWLAQIPGRTVSAVQLVMLNAALDDPQRLMGRAMRWLGARSVVASLMGRQCAGRAGQYDGKSKGGR